MESALESALERALERALELEKQQLAGAWLPAEAARAGALATAAVPGLEAASGSAPPRAAA